jgi:MarR family protein
VPAWSFLTNHARVLLCIAHDPGLRLRDIAARLGITERSAHGIITDLAAAGYVVKHKDGRRNRYQIQAHLPLPEPWTREPAIGDILAVLLGDNSTLLRTCYGRLITGRELIVGRRPVSRGEPGAHLDRLDRAGRARLQGQPGKKDD